MNGHPYLGHPEGLAASRASTIASAGLGDQAAEIFDRLRSLFQLSPDATLQDLSDCLEQLRQGDMNPLTLSADLPNRSREDEIRTRLGISKQVWDKHPLPQEV